MRSILDAEMIQSPDETDMLKVLLDVLVDHPEKYGSKDREELLSKANLIAPSILAGATSCANVSKEWMHTVDMVAGIGALIGPVVGGVGMTVVNTWLIKAIHGGKGKPRKEF